MHTTHPDLAPPAHPNRLDLKIRLINLAAVVVPFAGLVAAIVLLWSVAFDWLHLAILGGMYLLTALGITVGYHRLFTHKSFQTSRAVKYILAALGSMAAEGPVIKWAGVHRLHHQHSDDHLDPHSPHIHAGQTWGSGLRATLRGLAHAHLGWLFDPDPPDLDRYTRDLDQDPVLRAVSRQFGFWVFAGLAIPAALGGLLTMSWTGLLLGFLWGGLARLFLVHHVTWSVNSVCHLWGYQSFASHDQSRNNPVVGLLGLGEGWHNNHHAFPTSARHGLRWWEIDLSYLVIRLMVLLGLARAVRVPSPERLVAKDLRARPERTAPAPDGRT